MVHAVLLPYCLSDKFMDLPRQQVGAAPRQHRCREHQSAYAGDDAQKLQPGLGLLPHDQDLTKRDISYSLNLVFGSDADDETVFESTLQLPHEYKAQTAYFNILVPLRGTALYDNSRRRAG